jgi:DNA-binding CsgD family transcriptional regulator
MMKNIIQLDAIYSGSIENIGKIIEYLQEKYVPLLGYSPWDIISDRLILIQSEGEIVDLKDAIPCRIDILEWQVRKAEILRIVANESSWGYQSPFLAILFDALEISNRIPSRTIIDQPKLSEREIEVLCLWAEDRTQVQIANKLDIALGTVKKHISNISKKFKAKGKNDVIDWGKHYGFIKR